MNVGIKVPYSCTNPGITCSGIAMNTEVREGVPRVPSHHLVQALPYSY